MYEILGDEKHWTECLDEVNQLYNLIYLQMADEFTKAALYWIRTFNKKLKEKIWMGKLVELLNEYEIKRERKFEWFKRDRLPYYEWSNEELGDGTITYLWLDKEDYKWEELYWDSANAVLISKSYWFIKWLVENDKISNDWIKPRTDLVKEITIVDYKTGDTIWWKNKYTEVEQLIMYLSIQDEPIRFLCEILK